MYDVVEILKIGLPGLVFLLSMMSFRLLSKEQAKPEPSPAILKSIKQYMYVNILLAISTISAPLIEETNATVEEVNATVDSTYSAKATLSGMTLKVGEASVCNIAKYKYRYILVSNNENMRMIQVYANGIIPCNSKDKIVLSAKDAENLGLGNAKSIDVKLVVAEQGKMYVMQGNEGNS